MTSGDREPERVADLVTRLMDWRPPWGCVILIIILIVITLVVTWLPVLWP